MSTWPSLACNGLPLDLNIFQTTWVIPQNGQADHKRLFLNVNNINKNNNDDDDDDDDDNGNGNGNDDGDDDDDNDNNINNQQCFGWTFTNKN